MSLSSLSRLFRTIERFCMHCAAVIECQRNQNTSQLDGHACDYAATLVASVT